MTRRKPHAFDSEIVSRYKFIMPKQLGFPNGIAGILIRLDYQPLLRKKKELARRLGDGGNRICQIWSTPVRISRGIKANQKRPNNFNE